jgi:hypothetical protein
LDTRLDGFQRNIQDNQKDLSDTQLAKIDKNMSDSYKFKKRENKEQHKHNGVIFWSVLPLRFAFSFFSLLSSRVCAL